MAFSRRALLGASLATPVLLTLPTQAPAQAQPATAYARSARFRVGEIEVIALSDGYLPLPVQVIQGFDAAEAEAAAHQAYKRFDGEVMPIGINGFILRAGGRVIAVDCGAPSAVGETVGSWRASLAQAGITPGEIDTIFQTHLHMDHVGGLGDLGAGNRFLPNAQLVVSDAEWAFTHSADAYVAAPDLIRNSFDMARALVAPYAADAERLSMAQETEIVPGITAIPLPGHTPGHMGLRLSSGDETLLIWADAMHFQSFQFAHPDWSILFDADPAEAQATRARVMDMAASDRLRVAGSHLDFPSLGYVERLGEAYRYVPSGADYG